MRIDKFLLLLGGSMILLQSCEQPATRSNSMVYLHLQNSFNNDAVRITMDGSEVYNDTITTLWVLSLADIDSTEQSNGAHEINITVNNTVSHTETFNLSHNIYMGIKYDTSIVDTIDIEYSDEPYVYD